MFAHFMGEWLSALGPSCYEEELSSALLLEFHGVFKKTPMQNFTDDTTLLDLTMTRIGGAAVKRILALASDQTEGTAFDKEESLVSDLLDMISECSRGDAVATIVRQRRSFLELAVKVGKLRECYKTEHPDTDELCKAFLLKIANDHVAVTAGLMGCKELATEDDVGKLIDAGEDIVDTINHLAEKVVHVMMRKLVGEVKAIARGGLEEASWKEGLSATASWPDVLKQAEPLLDGEIAVHLNGKYKGAEEEPKKKRTLPESVQVCGVARNPGLVAFCLAVWPIVACFYSTESLLLEDSESLDPSCLGRVGVEDKRLS